MSKSEPFKKARRVLLVLLFSLTIIVLGLAGFIGASIGRDTRDRGFFGAGWEAGRKWEREHGHEQE